jgi:hypothetical protein
VQLLWDGLAGIVQTAWSFVKVLWDTLASTVQTAWSFVQRLWDGLAGIVQTAWSFVQRLWDGLGIVVMNAWAFVKVLWDSLGAIVTTAFSFVKTLWDNFSGIVKNAFGFLVTIFENFKTSFQTIWTFFSDNILKPLQSVGASIAKPLQDLFGKLGEFGKSIAEPIKQAFSGISDFFTKIGSAFQSLFKLDMKGFASTIGSAVEGAVSSVFKGLKTGLNAVIKLMNSMKIDPIDVGFKVLGKNVGFTIPGIDFVPGPDINYLARGGLAEGILAARGTDTVPAMLTPGEFVMSRPAVQQIGLDNLRAMNSGRSVSSGGDNYQVSIEINIDAKTTMDEGYIRGTLVPRMSEELKRASLDGKFVLSAKGIR